MRFVLLGGAVYVFTLSPNQTPYRDQYYLEKLVGLGSQVPKSPFAE